MPGPYDRGSYPGALGYTREGRPILADPAGGYETEKTATVEMEGRYYNIPTILFGQHVPVDAALLFIKAAGMRDPQTGVAIPAFPDLATATSAAQQRSGSLDADLENAGLIPRSNPYQ